MRKVKIFILMALAVFVLADVAMAQLKIAPVNANTGFPRWIGDHPQRRLDICVGSPLCEPIPVDATIRNFESAAYFNAIARLVQPAPSNVRVVAAFSIMATFRPAVRDPANAAVVNSMDIRLDGMPEAGTYQVLHPFGQTSIIVDATGGGRRTNSAIGRPGDNFQNAQNGPVKGVLTASRPAGFIGNGTLQFVTGGKTVLRNFVQVIAPAGVDIGGKPKTPNVLTISRFALEGKLHPSSVPPAP